MQVRPSLHSSSDLKTYQHRDCQELNTHDQNISVLSFVKK